MSKFIRAIILPACFAFTNHPTHALNHFFGVGFLGGGSLSVDEQYQGGHYGLKTQYEIGKEYRMGWLLSTGLDITASAGRGFISMPLGIKYIPDYVKYRWNLTYKSSRSCLFIFAPLFIFYDILGNALELLLPQHKFVNSGVIVGYEFGEQAGWGFFVTPGLTSGYVDFKVIVSRYYLQDFQNLDAAHTTVSLALTAHFSAGGDLIKWKPLVP